MSLISRSQIPAGGSTPRKVTTGIQRGNPTSSSDGSASSRSSRRHDALVEKLGTCVSVLVQDGTRERSLLGVFPGVLEGALLRFLGDARRRERRPGGTSSTRRGHFMDIRDRGPSPTRAEREKASQATVKSRRDERDREYLNRER